MVMNGSKYLEESSHDLFQVPFKHSSGQTQNLDKPWS